MARQIAYWVTTAMIAFVFLAGGIVDVARPAVVIEGMSHLGYASHVAVIIGVWKVLGGIAVLIPKTPLLKEWAYAGMVFDLTGAAASHASVGDSWDNVATPLVILIIVAASWALRPPSRTVATTRVSAPA